MVAIPEAMPDLSAEDFDLEDPQGVARISEPDTALRPLRGLVVVDEVQRRPDLFPLLRVLADRKPLPARFLILGSASPDLLRQSSETLAGRLETVPLEGFRLADLHTAAQTKHWVRGGFPPAFTARTEADSLAWRQQFLQTFLERDIPQLGVTIPAAALRRFWNMVAHDHGQIWNAAELARALALNESTVRRYLDLILPAGKAADSTGAGYPRSGASSQEACGLVVPSYFTFRPTKRILHQHDCQTLLARTY